MTSEIFVHFTMKASVNLKTTAHRSMQMKIAKLKFARIKIVLIDIEGLANMVKSASITTETPVSFFMSPQMRKKLS